MKKLHLFIMAIFLFVNMGYAQTLQEKGKTANQPEQQIVKADKSDILKASAIKAKRDNVLLQEGFEGQTGNNLPAGWTRSTTASVNGGTAGWLMGADYPDADPHTGSRCAYLYSWRQQPKTDAWLFSPGLELTAGSTYELNFWAIVYGWSNANNRDFLKVHIGTANNATDMENSPIIYENTTDRIVNWALLTETFTVPTTGTYYLAFHAFTPAGNGDHICLDDIELIDVTPPPTYLLQEGFEDQTGNNLPPGWTRSTTASVNGGGPAGWIMGADSPDADPHTGSRCAYLYSWRQMPKTDAWLFSPEIELTEGLTYQLNFWAIVYGWSNANNRDFLKVHIGTANNATDMENSPIIYENTTDRIINWTLLSETFTVPATGTYYLAFHAFTPAGNGDHICLDDIELIDTTPFEGIDCELTDIITPRTGINFSATEQVSVLISNKGTEPITGFNLELKLNGEIIATEVFSDIIENSEQAEFTFEATIDISAFGTYQITVTAIIEDDVNLDNNTLTKEITHVVPNNLPWFEGFTATTFPPTGWNRIHVGNPSANWTRGTGAPIHNGAYAMRPTTTGLEQVSYLISPPIYIADEVGTYTIDFVSSMLYMAVYGHSSVRISTSTNEITNAFSNIYTLSRPTQEDIWEPFSINIDNYKGKAIYIAFVYMGGQDHLWRIDDVTVKFVPIYTINVFADPEEGGEVEGGGDFNEGETTIVTAIANEEDHYEFINWTNLETGDFVSDEAIYEFIVSQNIDLVANFALEKFTVTVESNNEEWGTVSGGDIDIPYGTQITVTATPEEGYDFVHWSVEGSDDFYYQPVYQFTVTEDVNLLATFKPEDTFNVTINISPLNSGTVTGEGIYTLNELVEVSATPYLEYDFVNWTKDGEVLTTNTEYSFNISDDVTLFANFARKTYTITALVGVGGTITPSGNVVVEHGDDITLTITPDEGWTVLEVLVNNNPISTIPPAGGEYTFENVISNQSISVSFLINTYTITSSVGGGQGTITPLGVETVEHGASKTYTITPATNWEVIELLVNGSQISTFTPAGGDYTIENVTANQTIVATFELKKYIISASVSAGVGSISPNGNIQVFHGDDRSFAITPGGGWQVAQLLVNGSPVTTFPVTGGTYTFENITADHTIAVTFGLKSYIILSTVIEGEGTINPLGSTAVYHGDDQTYVITPATNWLVKELLVDGDLITIPIAGGSYTFEGVNTEHTIEVSFEKNTYNIEVSANPSNGGIVTGGGEYPTGESVIVEATANTGYEFVDWTEDGIQVCATESYSFTVENNRSLVANFKIIVIVPTYTVTVIATEGGSVEIVGYEDLSVVLDEGELITIKATSKDEDWQFNFWKDETEEVVSNDAEYTFNVLKDITLTAYFGNVGIKNNSLSGIVLYPNPFKNEIIISNHKLVKSVEIFDILGIRQKAESIKQNGDNVIDTSHLSNGVYFVVIENIKDEKTVHKMIKK